MDLISQEGERVGRGLRRWGPARAIAVLALLGVGVSGCAAENVSATLTADTFSSTVDAALAGVRSVHVSSVTTITDSQGRDWTLTLDADLALRSPGEVDARGTITTEAAGTEAVEADVILLDDIIYLRGDLDLDAPTPSATSSSTASPTPTPTPGPTQTGMPTPSPMPTAVAPPAWVQIDPPTPEGEMDAEPVAIEALRDLIARVQPAAYGVPQTFLRAVELTGPRATVDGVTSTQYTVVVGAGSTLDQLGWLEEPVEGEAATDLIPEAMIADYWIADDGKPSRVRFALAGIVQDVAFSAWNVPVQIVPPRIDEDSP